jgi:hypothetical protein
MQTSKSARRVAMVTFLMLLGSLSSSKTVVAQDSRLIMRGPHGAFQVLEPERSITMPTVPAVEKQLSKMTTNRSSAIVINRGPHGAGFVMTETGVGGPEGSGVYPGFPQVIMHGSHGAFSLQ